MLCIILEAIVISRIVSQLGRWEQQQRLFVEHMTSSSNQNKNKLVNEVSHGEWQFEAQGDSSGTQWYSLEDDWNSETWPVDSVSSSSKCQRCGSRKHGTDACQVDLSKYKVLSLP